MKYEGDKTSAAARSVTVEPQLINRVLMSDSYTQQSNTLNTVTSSVLPNYWLPFKLFERVRASIFLVNSSTTHLVNEYLVAVSGAVSQRLIGVSRSSASLNCTTVFYRTKQRQQEQHKRSRHNTSALLPSLLVNKPASQLLNESFTSADSKESLPVWAH